MTITIRTATVADEPFLWRMLCHATAMEGGDTPENVTQAQQDSMLMNYVAGWGRTGDLGVVAADAHGALIGAAWVRLATEPVAAGETDGHATAMEGGDTPELAIAVLSTQRGQGIGPALLQALIERAAGRYPAILLNVRETNPAVRLYTRMGFVTVGEMTNRIGGRSLVMRLPLSA